MATAKGIRPIYAIRVPQEWVKLIPAGVSFHVGMKHALDLFFTSVEGDKALWDGCPGYGKGSQTSTVHLHLPTELIEGLPKGVVLEDVLTTALKALSAKKEPQVSKGPVREIAEKKAPAPLETAPSEPRIPVRQKVPVRPQAVQKAPLTPPTDLTDVEGDNGYAVNLDLGLGVSHTEGTMIYKAPKRDCDFVTKWRARLF